MELEVECILCSPYPRALQTIQPFAEAAKIEIEVHPCLAEGQLLLTDAPAREEPKYFRHVSDHDDPMKMSYQVHSWSVCYRQKS